MRQYIDLFPKPRVLAELSTPRNSFDAVLRDDTIKVGFEFEVVLVNAHQPEYDNPFDLTYSDWPYDDMLEYFDVSSRTLDRYVTDWFEHRVRSDWESKEDEIMDGRAQENGFASAQEFKEKDSRGYYDTYHIEKEHHNESEWDDFDSQILFGKLLDDSYGGSVAKFAKDAGIDLKHGYIWADDTTVAEKSDRDFNEDYKEDHERILENYAEELQDYLGENVKVGNRGTKNPNSWYVEPDSSIEYKYLDGEAPCEIVSRVYPVGDGIDVLRSVFEWIDRHAKTNNSTGLHINLSIEDKGAEDYDVLKMMLFYDENYVAKQFERITNRYAKMTRSQIGRILALIGQENPPEARTPAARDALVVLDDLAKTSKNTRMIDEFIAIMRKMFSVVDGQMEAKYRSLNPRNNGVFEFRSMGGQGYENKYDLIRRNMVNFAYLLKIGSDPAFKREEYIKKLTGLLHGKFDTVDARVLPSSDAINSVLSLLPSWSSVLMKNNKLGRLFKKAAVAHNFSWQDAELIAGEMKTMTKKQLDDLVAFVKAIQARGTMARMSKPDEYFKTMFTGRGVKII